MEEQLIYLARFGEPILTLSSQLKWACWMNATVAEGVKLEVHSQWRHDSPSAAVAACCSIVREMVVRASRSAHAVGELL